jgi:S-adenosylmethionine synthetase
VDRSAAYAARYVAKNLVAAGLADRAEVQLSYAIGVARPTSVFVDSFGTVKNGLTDGDLSSLVNQAFDLRPAAIIQKFNLTGLPAQRGGRFYQDLAAYGHIGRNDLDVPWEALDAVSSLQSLSKSLIKEVVTN